MTSPRFPPPLHSCIFLGTEGNQDLYYWPGKVPAIVIRWGSGASDYQSILIRDFPALQAAFRKVVLNGLPGSAAAPGVVAR